MAELQRLRADHGQAVLAFELARYDLRMLRAATSRGNAASQKVLIKAGFVAAGPADPARLGGKPGTWYQRHLTAAGVS